MRFYFLDLEDFRRAAECLARRRMLNLVHLDRSIGRFVSRAGRRFPVRLSGPATRSRGAPQERSRSISNRAHVERALNAAAARLPSDRDARRRTLVWPTSIRQREYKHHAERHVAAGALRDVMLGLNDGLVASFAVTSGVAGAFSNPSVVIMAGLAEMLGGAVSMGLAAFISARSQIEFYQSEVDRERYEINRFPEHERDEIRGIYKQKGFSGPLLDQIVAHITGDPDRWADVMMREELGFTEENFESPLKSIVVVGASYLIGATVPVGRISFPAPRDGIVLSAIITVLVLFAVGAAKTIITTRSWWRSGIESMLTGIAAGRSPTAPAASSAPR